MVVNAKNEVIPVSADSILEEVAKRKEEGYRLVQICATRTPEGNGNEVTYSLGKDYDLLGLRYVVEDGKEVASISHIFPSAYLYENEIHDLFGTSFSMMTVDFKGNLYRTETKTPYKETKA